MSEKKTEKEIRTIFTGACLQVADICGKTRYFIRNKCIYICCLRLFSIDNFAIMYNILSLC